MLDEAQRAVEEFHRKCGLPVSTNLTKLDRTRVKLRAKWMSEEIEEFLEARDPVGQADAIADLIYYAIGVFIEMGLDGGKIFEFVHKANMKKLGSEGKPRYDTNGRVAKPIGWVSPREQISRWLKTIGRESDT